jgi:ferredoxin
LATSNHVRDFCESYFSRDIPAGPDGYDNLVDRISRPVMQGEQEKVDTYYRNYLHHQVITSDDAIQLLKDANLQTDEHERAVVKLPCICRHAAYGSDQALSCFAIAFTDIYTRRFPMYLGGRHQYVSAQEAICTINNWVQTDTIVHAISALGVPYLGMLCNCDMEVCRPYIERKRLGIKSPFYKGHEAAFVCESLCVGCGRCGDLCPFDAIEMNLDDNVAHINQEACFGCGVCANHCENQAIQIASYDRTKGF